MKTHSVPLHPSFSIQGKKHNTDTLIQYAQSLLNDSELYLRDLGHFLLEYLDENPFIIAHTSGSTGTPKPYQIEKLAMVAHTKLTAAFFNLQPKNKVLLCLSTQFIAGKMMVVRALSLGLDLWLAAPSNSPLIGFDVRFDFMAMVPSQLEKSIPQLSKAKQILIGGAPLNERIKLAALQKISESDTRLFLSYGMTETLSHIAIATLALNTPTIFEILPTIGIRQNDQGCLLIRAPYISQREIVTTDVVHMKDSSHFEWLGRADFIINSGGVKLHPERLEKQYAAHFNIPFFFSPIPHETLGEQIVLVVHSKDLAQAKALLNTLAFTSKYHKPKGILTVSKFIYTSTHKIRRALSLKLGYETTLL